MIAQFVLWTLLLYIMHRAAHVVPLLRHFHRDHHKQVIDGVTGWHWSNLFLFNDTWMSTADLWLTEVIPTIVFCYATGGWWLLGFYYLWAALIQERIEHDLDFNLPMLTSGSWHMVHHMENKVNYGVFIPVWDILFGTYAPRITD